MVSLPVIDPPLSASAAETKADCQRKAWFRYFVGIRTAHPAFSEALSVGTTMHRCMEMYARGISGPDVRTRVVKDTLDALGPLRLNTGLADEAEKGALKANAMAVALSQQLLNTKTGVWFAKKVIGLELAVATMHNTCRAVGQLDTLIEDNHGIVVEDYKTTSMSPSLRVKTIKGDAQTVLYPHLARAFVGAANMGDPTAVTRMRHYIIRRPTIRQKKGQTHDAYLKEVNQWYMDKAQDQNDPPIVVSTVDLTQRDAHPMWQAHDGEFFADWLRNSHFCGVPWPMTANKKTCLDNFGVCPYYDLCYSDPATWPQRIKNDFVVDHRYVSPDGNYLPEVHQCPSKP